MINYKEKYSVIHLLTGVDLVYIQQLMGHASIKTTSKDLHLKDTRVFKIKNPLDTLSTDENA